MVYNTQNYWVFFWTLTIVRYSKKLENTTFRKLVLFPSSREGTDRSSFRKVMLSSFLDYRTMDKARNPSNSEHKNLVSPKK
jgi:hypothetical protein